MKFKNLLTLILLVVFIILENYFLFEGFHLGKYTQGKNAFLLMGSSIMVGLVVLFRFYNAQLTTISTTTKYKWAYALLLIPTAWLAYHLFPGLKAAIAPFPIDPTYSDIVPMLQVMSRRLLNGTNPYAPVNLHGYYGYTTYLTMHWLPFTVAEYFKFDYRYIPYFMSFIAVAVLVARQAISGRWLGALVLLYLVFRLQQEIQLMVPSVLGYTIELIVCAYYMLLILGLNLRNGWLQGMLIAFCMLSRYSLVLWLPLFAFVMWASGHRKQLWQTIVGGFVTVLLLYVIPFLITNWKVFLESYGAYGDAALGEWNHINPDTGRPYHLFSGTGFAYWIYTRLPQLTIPEKIKLLQRIHLIASLGVVTLMGVWYAFKKHKIDHRIFLMVSFKIYLTVFLFFIQVPYQYLIVVGSFVSLAILAEQWRYKLQPLSTSEK